MKLEEHFSSHPVKSLQWGTSTNVGYGRSDDDPLELPEFGDCLELSQWGTSQCFCCFPMQRFVRLGLVPGTMHGKGPYKAG